MKANKRKLLNSKVNAEYSEESKVKTLDAEMDTEKEDGRRSKALANLYRIAGEGWGNTRSIPEREFLCPSEEGYFQSGFDCAVYYRCVHGVGVRLHCGGGLVWNSGTGLCDWAHSVQCQENITDLNLAPKGHEV